VVLHEGQPDGFVASSLEVITTSGVRRQGVARVLKDAPRGIETCEQELAVTAFPNIAMRSRVDQHHLEGQKYDLHDSSERKKRFVGVRETLTVRGTLKNKATITLIPVTLF
jgi:hypothetical protein